MFNNPAIAPKAHGCHPCAEICASRCVHFKYTLSPTNPKACMNRSVRYAPTRRDEKRARKSATPQHTAPANPRTIPKIFPAVDVLFFLRLQSEDAHHLLQIFPHLALGVRIA